MNDDAEVSPPRENEEALRSRNAIAKLEATAPPERHAGETGRTSGSTQGGPGSDSIVSPVSGRSARRCTSQMHTDSPVTRGRAVQIMKSMTAVDQLRADLTMALIEILRLHADQVSIDDLREFLALPVGIDLKSLPVSELFGVV